MPKRQKQTARQESIFAPCRDPFFSRLPAGIGSFFAQQSLTLGWFLRPPIVRWLLTLRCGTLEKHAAWMLASAAATLHARLCASASFLFSSPDKVCCFCLFACCGRKGSQLFNDHRFECERSSASAHKQGELRRAPVWLLSAKPLFEGWMAKSFCPFLKVFACAPALVGVHGFSYAPPTHTF